MRGGGGGGAGKIRNHGLTLNRDGKQLAPVDKVRRKQVLLPLGRRRLLLQRRKGVHTHRVQLDGQQRRRLDEHGI